MHVSKKPDLWVRQSSAIQRSEPDSSQQSLYEQRIKTVMRKITEMTKKETSVNILISCEVINITENVVNT